MSEGDQFRQSARDFLKRFWTKTFNPFDEERPRVAKYPASITDHAEVELDGVRHMFRITIKDMGTVEDFMRRAEELSAAPNPPMPAEMLAEVQRVSREFEKDMAEGNFKP